MTLDFERRDPDRMAELLESAGFTLRLRTLRAPDEEIGDTAPQAFLIGRKGVGVAGG